MVRIPQKLQEHYGITVPISSAPKITQEHAARVLQQHQTQSEIPTSMGIEQLIVEIDGSMIPRSENGSDYGPRSENRSAQNSHRRLARSSLMFGSGEGFISTYLWSHIG